MTPAAHIALVEDDAEIRSLMAAMLEDEGYRISRCADGRELDRLLSREAPDLVVLDLMLPGEGRLSICCVSRWGATTAAIC